MKAEGLQVEEALAEGSLGASQEECSVWPCLVSSADSSVLYSYDDTLRLLLRIAETSIL